MIKNYFKTAFRNLTRNKTYTIINVVGLAIGIAICLVIFLVIKFEKSFDNFHKKQTRIYRVLTEFHDANGINASSGVPFPLPKALRTDFPQLEKITSIYSSGNDQILVLDESKNIVKKFKEEKGVFFTEPEFFDIFDFKWITGNPASLNEPNTAVLTRSTAEKYFGKKSAIGKIIKRNNKQELKIAGIIEDVPANTDFQFKIVISFNTIKSAASEDWGSVSSSMGCYILLPDKFSAGQLKALLPAFVKKYKSGDDANNPQVIQSLSEVHFDNQAGNYLGRTISKQLINGLMFIAVFILVIACVNFINLSTAQSVNRSKEVGIRKVLGSRMGQLRVQFLSETSLIVIIAVAIALMLAFICMPFIKNLLDLPLANNIFHDGSLVIFLLLLIPVVIFLSGFYPSLILSRFNPIAALKSKAAGKNPKRITIRKGLVVVQFIIAQALIIGTLVIITQMNYFNSTSMGFDKDAIITVPFPTDSAGISKLDFLRNKLSGQKSIEKFSLGFAAPAQNGNWYSNFRFDHSEKETDFGANLKWADENYLNTYGLKLIAGNNIKKSDTATGFIVNETLLKMIGITDPLEGLNKEINMWDGKIKANIVGVISDFHSQSLQQAISPVLIASNKETYNMAGIKIKTKQLESGVKDIEKIWGEIYPENVFEYQFLDKNIAAFYSNEIKLSKLYKIFAGIAIFLSCLGLYGLASFMSVQRIKEVGIRKVLGASISHIVYLFSKEFILLISIAFVLASAVSYYYMQEWLNSFTYRIDLSWWIFLLAGLLSLVTALITVSSHAIKSAMTNPVKSLRTE